MMKGVFVARLHLGTVQRDRQGAVVQRGNARIVNLIAGMGGISDRRPIGRQLFLAIRFRLIRRKQKPRLTTFFLSARRKKVC
jgi:hypothetical protein